MSPLFCCCVLCGSAVVDWPDIVSWRNQFRGLYSGPEGLVLTGLGLYDDPDRGLFIAPADTTASWTDPDCQVSDEDAFGANQQSPRNGRHGFVFHGACWALLERYLQPVPAPRSRLLEVLNSLPFPLESTAINWGHDYGGSVLVHDQYHYPWEDRYVDPEEPEPDPVLQCDPYDLTTEFDALLADPPQQPDSLVNTLSPDATATSRDCFANLPTELCLTIASHLPTSDALHTRLASRAFWPTLHDQQFWASRFWPSCPERSWLFESQGTRRAQDWRWLYRQTHNSRLTPALKNRRRVWRLIEHVVKILHLRSDGLAPQSPLAPESGLGAAEISPTAIVAGDLKELRPDQPFSLFNKGCRTFHRRELCIPEKVDRFSVSTVDVGGTQYIAGLRLTSAAGDVVEVGFNSGHGDSVRESRLCGFHVAVGSKGIQAVQCVHGEGEPSRWLGSPGDCPRTKRLANFDCCPTEMQVGFDGCKMTSLATCLPRATSLQGPDSRDSLRTSALWYPEVPSPLMCLNEDSFVPRESYLSYLSGFRPLVLTHFGGPGGKYLRHLTGITVVGVGDVRRMDFSYDNEVKVPPECRSFGRHRPNESLTVSDFPIDGPGGEAVVAVDGVYWTTEWTILVFCKITTNRGRSLAIPQEVPQPRHSTTVETTHVLAGPGTEITGFYGAQDPEFGLGIIALGVISETAKEADQ